MLKLAYIAIALLSATISYADESERMAEALNAIVARRARLDNISVRFRRIEQFQPRAGSPKELNLPGGVKLVPMTGAATYQGSFRYFNGRAMYSRDRANDVGQDGIKRTIHAISTTRTEHLVETDGVTGSILRVRQLPQLEYIDIALGLRAYNSNEWLSEEMLRSARRQLLENGRVQLQWTDEENARVNHEMIFEPRFGYALVEFRRMVDGKVSMGITASKFARVDNLILPFKFVHKRLRHENVGAVPSETVTFDVENYVLGDPRNRDDDFRIEWPLQAVVVDGETGAQIRITSRPQKLDDELLVKAATVIQPESATPVGTIVLLALAALTIFGITVLAVKRIRSTR